MSDQESLYKESDPVHVMNDSFFFFKDGKGVIQDEQFAGAGVIKAYAPWCPHCKDKVRCINILAEILEPEGLAVYVINAEANPHFSEGLGVEGYPTFYEVTAGGVVGKRLLKPNGEPVGTVPDIVVALCKNQAGICNYAKHLQTLNGKGC